MDVVKKIDHRLKWAVRERDDVLAEVLSRAKAEIIGLQVENARLRSELDAAYERAAKWHEEQAAEWEKLHVIAVAKKHPEEMTRTSTLALQHVSYAEAIRSLKSGDRDHG